MSPRANMTGISTLSTVSLSFYISYHAYKGNYSSHFVNYSSQNVNFYSSLRIFNLFNFLFNHSREIPERLAASFFCQ